MSRDEKCLVSVVVPCFNAAPFIEETIDSVLKQSFEDLEVIVVDDESTDNSTEVVTQIASRDCRVRLIRMGHNAGAPAAPRNLGVREARGEWIAFLDADDLWHPRKLEFQMRSLGETGTQLCSTQMIDFQDGKPVRLEEPASECARERIDFRKQITKYRTPTSSIVVRKRLVLDHPFNEDIRYKAREDTDCFIRLHEYMAFSIKLRHPFVYYRVRGSQISGNKLTMVYRHLRMLRKYRLRSGRSLGLRAYYFTLTHFSLSLYYRLLRRML